MEAFIGDSIFVVYTFFVPILLCIISLVLLKRKNFLYGWLLTIGMILSFYIVIQITCESWLAFLMFIPLDTLIGILCIVAGLSEKRKESSYFKTKFPDLLIIFGVILLFGIALFLWAIKDDSFVYIARLLL